MHSCVASYLSTPCDRISRPLHSGAACGPDSPDHLTVPDIVRSLNCRVHCGLGRFCCGLSADLYDIIRSLRRVSDGISRMESDLTQSLIYLGLDAPQSATKLVRMPWMSDELNEDEAWSVVALAHLAFDAPGALERIMSMPWVADGISEDDSWAITAVSDLAMESGGAASRLVSYHWFADDIDAEESMVMSMLGSISYETVSAAQFMGMQFLDSIEAG